MTVYMYYLGIDVEVVGVAFSMVAVSLFLHCHVC